MGNIGTGLYKILQMNREKVENLLGRNVEIRKVLVRNLNKNRKIDIGKELLTTKVEDIIDDPEIDIVVELIGGINPAVDYIKRSIEKGKHVVTANKAVIATYGKELRNLADEKGVQLKYEASVAGGIPIIDTLINSLSSNDVEEIIGIINGTTNYILTQMSHSNISFENALKKAQEKGYAEADPTSDVEGYDAAFKLTILSAVAFGETISPDDISREGITKVCQEDIKYASKLDYNVKLLASAKKYNNSLELHVHPALIPKKHPLASVDNEFNALFVRGNAVGELMFYGKGAGSLPTGSAVLADIITIGKTNKMEQISDKVITNNDLKINGQGIGQYYVRLKVIDKPGVLGKIATTFGEYRISLDSVVQIGRDEKIVPLVFITHEIEKLKLDKALEVIREFSVVKEVSSILKVENL
ncbi:homoserine dehydrogenase [Thermohalobacter berrensis]|uniref:Homoserine dehydrogenase n=2 Tax=Thermohalobacter berrensis TaxID=99594 RepID=A0A419T2N0_9FIRM|nr:homoserine dehydrogenase [Thermohalobacter berrensis]